MAHLVQDRQLEFLAACSKHWEYMYDSLWLGVGLFSLNQKTLIKVRQIHFLKFCFNQKKVSISDMHVTTNWLLSTC